MSDTRLNRYLASCGLGSRRSCEALVTERRVSLNGAVVSEFGVRVKAGDEVKVDGRVVRPARPMVVVLNKPRRCLCSRVDPQGRRTVYELLPQELGHLAHVGRLDQDSEGLLVLTNCGELSQRLTRPGSAVEKEYLVWLDHVFDMRHRRAFLEGIETPEGLARAVAVRALEPRVVRVVLTQGLKRQVRLMFEAYGYTVVRLLRTRIGRFSDPHLKPGKWRRLSDSEVEFLTVSSGVPAGVVVAGGKGRRKVISGGEGAARRVAAKMLGRAAGRGPGKRGVGKGRAESPVQKRRGSGKRGAHRLRGEGLGGRRKRR